MPDNKTIKRLGLALADVATFDLAGYSDWRLPKAKKLQGIVDYTRAPSAKRSAAWNCLPDQTGIRPVVRTILVW